MKLVAPSSALLLLLLFVQSSSGFLSPSSPEDWLMSRADKVAAVPHSKNQRTDKEAKFSSRSHADHGHTTNALRATIEPESRELGESFTLSCASNPDTAALISTCWFQNPDGQRYTVDIDQDQVVDTATKQAVTHMTTDSNGTVCNLTILKMNKCHQGTWLCHVELQGVSIFQEAFISAHSSPWDVGGIRLPGNLLPNRYNVKLIVDMNQSMLVGQVDIELEVMQNTSVIVLHSRGSIIFEKFVTVVSQEDGSYPIKGFGYDKSRDFFLITLGQELSKGRQIRVSMEFCTLIEEYTGNDLPTGVYLSRIQAPHGQNSTELMVGTDFQPESARRAFPCLDEPHLKAVFTTWIGRQPSQLSRSNMPQKKAAVPITMEEGPAYYTTHVWDQYEPTVRMSTYLNAFIVSGDYKSVLCQGKSDHECRVWAPDAQKSQMTYAAQVATPLMTHFESLFNRSYDLPKVDHVFISAMNYYAMENYGLVTYGDDAALIPPGEGTTLRKEQVVNYVGHECAHMWFGNLVTMKWWDDIWLNEGFASYYSEIAASHLDPSSKREERLVNVLHQLMEIDTSPETEPVSFPVEKRGDPDRSFTVSAYTKGALVVRMLVGWLGQDIFLEGIRSYLDDHEFDSVTSDDLWTALDRAARSNGRGPSENLTVKQVMDPWILQKGFPVVHVERDYDKGEVTLGQRHFLEFSEDQTSVSQWYVPISYAVPGIDDFADTAPSFWLLPNILGGNRTVPVDDCEDEPLILNVQQTGIYRVNYDIRNWQLLIRTLYQDPDCIHEINRAQLLDDVWVMALNEHQNLSTALDLALYLQLEQDYVPLRSGFRIFRDLMYLVRQDAALGDLRKFMLGMVGHVYDRIGLQPFREGTYTDRLLRPWIGRYVCLAGQRPDCQESARKVFQQWMNQSDPDQNNPIELDTEEVIYCSAIMTGGEEEWDFLFQRYLNSRNQQIKTMAAVGLGCTAEPWIMNRLLARLLDPSIPWEFEHVSWIVESARDVSPVGPSLLWRWLQADAPALLSRFGHAQTSRLADMITQHFNREFEVKQLQALRDSGVMGQELNEDLDWHVERARKNVKKRGRMYDTVADWLSRPEDSLCFEWMGAKNTTTRKLPNHSQTDNIPSSQNDS